MAFSRSTAMPLSAEEQYLLELINRGRLDPAGEAARYGIDLNAGLAAGTISATPKQVLAPNALLENAAIAHSKWMLATDIFSHTGANGSNLGTRASAEGYKWSLLGENIAVWGTSGTINVASAINEHHKGLFRSAGHRSNLMNSTLSEVGLAQETGKFRFSAAGPEYNASMLTELFGSTAGKKFLTGVAFTDLNKDGFYSVGEGRAQVKFAVTGAIAVTEAAGGYAVATTAPGNSLVTGQVGSVAFSATVDFTAGNTKLDIMNATTFLSSASIILGTGLHNVNLLGIGHLNATGNAASNVILGNSGANRLAGASGNDTINGGLGNDLIAGDLGNDRLIGGLGLDTLSGGGGNDYLLGSDGADRMNGGIGADHFAFANGGGSDVVEDFSLQSSDRLLINDDLWVGSLSTAQIVARYASVTSAGVVFNFGDGDMLTLAGVTSTAGLAGAILIW
jgi:serralysin